MRFSNFGILVFCCSILVQSQQNALQDAKQTVRQLTSKKMAGRGYTKNGMSKAATYLKNEFRKRGVRPINNSYFQEFTYPVNVIHKATLRLNNHALTFGKDFLVLPSTKTIQAKNSSNFKIVNQQQPIDAIQNKVFLSKTEKLTHYVLPNRTNFTIFSVHNQAFPKEVQNISYNVKSEYKSDFRANNVVGVIPGKSDSIVILSAHYDHLGQVGESVFYGANDNASGVAMLLSLAKNYQTTQPKYTLVLIAFAGEEAGLKGSFYFANNPMVDLKKVKFLLNFDILGTGDEGIQIVNGSVYAKEFNLLQQINQQHKGLKQIKKRGFACNSDHCAFHQKGIKSFFIYTLGGAKHYHDLQDNVDNLSLVKFTALRALLIQFLNQLE